MTYRVSRRMPHSRRQTCTAHVFLVLSVAMLSACSVGLDSNAPDALALDRYLRAPLIDQPASANGKSSSLSHQSGLPAD